MQYQSIVISENKTIPVDKQWINFIEYLRNTVQYGTIELEVKDGKPYKANQVIKSTLF